MKTKKTRAFFIIAICGVFLSCCAFPISSTTVKGYVMNYGKPVDGAKVIFGGIVLKTETTTDENGFFTVTARHGLTQMLYLTAEKKGYSMQDKVEFPAVFAPDDDVTVEILKTVSY